MAKKNFATYALVALLFGGMGAYVAVTSNKAEPLPAAAAPSVNGPVQALFAQSLPDAAGKGQALSQWKGKAMVVNFWAPWCAPCVEEMPELSALQQEMSGKNVQVIGIGIDSPGNIAQFAEKVKISYPVYVAGMGGTDLSRQFGNTAGGLPYTVLIGADGQVKKTYLGRLKFEQLRADLATL
ncbi:MULTISPECIES: TlpA family protein disulfide reductase [unclassified Janthinobacterium]|uniref:TlpA family protein disulfide reductase n=1 Tax=unclassified Janthinobacterium TaxID=2610881 RepID=UPI0003493CB2|nr:MULTISPECIES: TlpA disulfide reductase family protein [unclassified Janthinobacterium]MEC5159615.1 thiol-disulfide isomerase/thioredoxin [Janthinobacterium sp. CG_S6]